MKKKIYDYYKGYINIYKTFIYENQKAKLLCILYHIFPHKIEIKRCRNVNSWIA